MLLYIETITTTVAFQLQQQLQQQHQQRQRQKQENDSGNDFCNHPSRQGRHLSTLCPAVSQAFAYQFTLIVLIGRFSTTSND